MSSVTPASTMGLSPFTRQNRRVAAVIDTDDLKRLTQVAEGRIGAGRGWRARGRTVLLRPGPSRVITPILTSPGVFLVRKARLNRVQFSDGKSVAQQVGWMNARLIQAVIELLAQGLRPTGAKKFAGGCGE